MSYKSELKPPFSSFLLFLPLGKMFENVHWKCLNLAVGNETNLVECFRVRRRWRTSYRSAPWSQLWSRYSTTLPATSSNTSSASSARWGGQLQTLRQIFASRALGDWNKTSISLVLNRCFPMTARPVVCLWPAADWRKSKRLTQSRAPLCRNTSTPSTAVSLRR